MTVSDPSDFERRAPLRRPQRARGVQRFEALLDAAEHLLESRPDEEVSLAAIAAHAGVPLPSVYHFFGNRTAVLVALAGRYHRRLADLARRSLDQPPESWQALIAARQRNGAAYLNAHPVALRLFMGAGVSAEVRNLDLGGNAALAATSAEAFRRHFDCAHLRDLERWLAISIGLMDGIWAISWSETGRITEDYLRESIRASCAYLRCWLPEELPLRRPDSAR